MAPKQQNEFRVLVTAHEAWPAFEEAVLGAETEIKAGFRVFDLATRLRSDAARAVGETWFDLLEHVLRRGIRVHLILSDFDPVIATQMHELTWRTKRQAAALAEILGPDMEDRLQVTASLHPARAGTLPRLAFLPAVLKRQYNQLRKLDKSRLERQAVHLNSDCLPEMHTVTHHQKLAVIDRRVCYLGGLDLNERRYDTPGHDRPAKDTWSDIQLLVAGPEAEEAAQHLDRFEKEIEQGQAAPKPQFLRRTLSAPRRPGFLSLSPKTIAREIEEDHLSAFRTARHLIHIETQYFRSTEIAEGLAEAAERNGDLRLILVLPSLPEEVAFGDHQGLDARYGMELQANCLDLVTAQFGDRACVATPVQPVTTTAAEGDLRVLAGSPIIHVHNKVLVQDDALALVGSANLNGRSLRWDTEVGLCIPDPARVAVLRRALTNHWWQAAAASAPWEPSNFFEWWSRGVRENGVRRPEARRGLLVPHDPTRSQGLRQAIPGVTEDIV